MIKLNLKSLFMTLCLLMSLPSFAQNYTAAQLLSSMKESLNSGKSEKDFYGRLEIAVNVYKNGNG